MNERIGTILQDHLVDLIGLSLNAKQAHWHVTGPQFVPVHEQLDRIVDDARLWSDDVAERAVALGFDVDGRPRRVATDTVVEDFPAGFVGDAKAVLLVRDQVEAVVGRLRSSLDELGTLDPVTQDLVIGILHGLEKHLWMLRAQAS